MASSNRHWPSMFKSKPCNTPHQWHHEINPSICTRSATYPTGGGGEERSPEPKPRWNPRPEQIRILEAIFNSGMVNPPRDEIRKIRTQLQEYGQVGDANVFYWFQNRKSRTKLKLRQSSNNNNKKQQKITTTNTAAANSSSSSDGSSPTAVAGYPPNGVLPVSSSPPPIAASAAINQLTVDYFQTTQGQFLQPEGVPYISTIPASSMVGGGQLQGLGFSSNLLNFFEQVPDHDERVGHYLKNGEEEEDVVVMEKVLKQQLSYTVHNPTSDQQHPSTHSLLVTPLPSTCLTVASTTINQSHQGVRQSDEVGLARCTVFINDVAFEVAVGPFSVRDAFGDDAVLLHSSGHPVVTNEWGVTVHPLQHGAFYYLARTLSPLSAERDMNTCAAEMVAHELPF